MNIALRTATVVAGLAIAAGSLIVPSGTVEAANDHASGARAAGVADMTAGTTDRAHYPQVPLGWRKVSLVWD